MGGHIRMDKDLLDDPRVERLADQLLREWAQQGLPESVLHLFREAARNAALGSLYRLWRYADTYLEDDDSVTSSVTSCVTVTGLSVTSLHTLPPEWFIQHEGGRLELPHYSDKNALISKEKRREQTRLRVRLWRERQALNQPPTNSNGAVTALHPRAPARPRAPAGVRARWSRDRDRDLRTSSQPFSAAEPAEKGSTAKPNPPKANGTNPRALGTSPRAARLRSLSAWRTVQQVVDAVRATNGSTWADAQARVDSATHLAIERLGGYRLIAERDRYTTKDLQARFRSAYEQIEQHTPGDPHATSH